MPDARSNEANVRAGIAVIGAITAGAALLWAGMAWNDSRTLDYVVWFTPEEGVYGIREGSVVRVGGLPMGRVRSVQAHFAKGEIDAYDVRIAVRSNIRLYQGVRIEAAADPVSGDGAIEPKSPKPDSIIGFRASLFFAITSIAPARFCV